MDTAAGEVASDPDVEPPVLPALQPETHPLAGVFEDWAWLAVWTAKWLREQRARKKCEQRRSRRARRACARKESHATGVSEHLERVDERHRECGDGWRSRVRREAKERRELLREEAHLRERWAKEEEEEIDDDALCAGPFSSLNLARPGCGSHVPPLLFGMSLGAGVGTSPVHSRTTSPTSTENRGDDSSATSRGTSLSTSLASSPALAPGLDPISALASTWVTWAKLLTSRRDGSGPLLRALPAPKEDSAIEPPPEPPPSRPAVVPELLMRKLSLLRTDDLCEPEFTKQDSAPFSGGENEDEVLDDVAKRYQMSRGGMELKAHEQITDLLHAFVGHEEFRRLNAAASVQQTLLHELVQVHEEQDRDMDVWNEAQRHAVAQILEGGSQSKELANMPVSAMQRLLNNRGYELPEPQKAQNLGRGSFGRVLKVRRTKDGQLFAVKRQFLGDFADDMVPVLRETSILNLLKGACNVVQIEDAFLMRPSKGAAEVWSVLEHFPHNLYKVRHRFRSEEAARRVIYQVLLGLHSLHSADIVHRDVKPDNVLVDLGTSPPYTLRVAICDFNTSRSVHGFPSESNSESSLSSSELPPPFQMVRKLTDRVTTSWWRAPEMWGWADTRQMTKRDLKSLDVFSLGLVWAELLAVKSVLEFREGVDPPKFRLLEILQKVDRPTDADLNELGFSDDVSCFIRCILSGNSMALRPEMTSEKWPNNQEKREALLEVPYLGIRGWVGQNAWQCSQDSPTTDMIASMARFSYRERPTVKSLLEHPHFSDLHAQTPSTAWISTAPHFDDVREVMRSEHERQGKAAKRAKELRALLNDSGAGGAGAAQDAFFQRMAANTAADVEDSVRSGFSHIRKAIKETQRRGPRGSRGRPIGCQGKRPSGQSRVAR